VLAARSFLKSANVAGSLAHLHFSAAGMTRVDRENLMFLTAVEMCWCGHVELVHPLWTVGAST
jgi:hypothetical protein